MNLRLTPAVPLWEVTVMVLVAALIGFCLAVQL